MTTYTAIPDASLEPGKPARSVDAILLRDNPIAITEGAAGAPKIQAAALDVTTAERDWVLDRNSEASLGAVGTYAFLHKNSAGSATPGSTVAGSDLRYTSASTQTTTTPSGTWRCMGYTTGGGAGLDDGWNTLFLRIS